MNSIFIVGSPEMSEQAALLVGSEATSWAGVDPPVMKRFLVELELLHGQTSVVTNVAAVKGIRMDSLNVFLQLDSLAHFEVTMAEGAPVLQCWHPRLPVLILYEGPEIFPGLTLGACPRCSLHRDVLF